MNVFYSLFCSVVFVIVVSDTGPLMQINCNMSQKSQVVDSFTAPEGVLSVSVS